MSCCRAGGPRFARSRPQFAARCVNCAVTLRQEAKDKIAKVAASATTKGTHHTTLVIKCPGCGWENRVPAVFDVSRDLRRPDAL